MVKYIKKKSLTGQYELLESNNGKYILIRESKSNNEYYISLVAGLSFHKALFGISELKALEKISKNSDSLKMSVAINTYYVVYNIMTLIMLIDEEYPITIKCKSNQEGRILLEVNKESLNREGESSKDWDEMKFLERDIASQITHMQIKDYCKEVRSNFENKSEPVKIVYEAFMSEQANVILYEKLCYVRDRLIYRPTCVLADEIEQLPILTSLDVRKEIADLPNWKDLYQIVFNLYESILKIIKESEKQTLHFYEKVIHYMWYWRIEESVKYLYNLGWTEEDVTNYGQYIDFEEDKVILSSYLAHLVEIADINRIRQDIKELWNPLKVRFENYGNISRFSE
ncbi:hypothetical protein COJ87_19925 [Bacillus cereus]|uniref:hypothetical protein n=1 Tax=Bacillus cereus TaxID=1396 RepID=UPI000BEBE01F|nr:hypothetical protein [Bacillus cereus]PEC89408.1 hypothetical protein CON02_20220 [Bacillus cereus]PFO03467.1 hypothetical protein COJ68_01610 [Bacillus cereus]PFO75290.1 hypothetical protein COJ87_19925 [Bacillus cereus]PGN75025.1 hypothetical protein CN963_28270 [Bacillus cereus]